MPTLPLELLLYSILFDSLFLLLYQVVPFFWSSTISSLKWTNLGTVAGDPKLDRARSLDHLENELPTLL